MTLSLGIHNGHHASCAITQDNVLIAAVSQERFSRVKHDGQECLSNRLPLQRCLNAAGVSLADIEVIVSSFQAASPGGVGMHRPLVDPDFTLFDVSATNHFVISHHYAHALSTFEQSGFQHSGVLVCDLGGSTTTDGADFLIPFMDYSNSLSSLRGATQLRTECMSIYDASSNSINLKHREFCVPHNAPDIFIQSAASLYDNVARTIFRKDHAHGQLMALASIQGGVGSEYIRPDELFAIEPSGTVSFRNDWQYRILPKDNVLDYVPFASAAQKALQSILLQYARLARHLTRHNNLAVSGGVFLNILANTEIASSGVFDDYYAPSAPHDAGIAVGCAFAGYRKLNRRDPGRIGAVRQSDRLGPEYSVCELGSAVGAKLELIDVVGPVSSREVALLLSEGKIAARFYGRSEFGPRALGARSILASPLDGANKERLNLIKGRQPWRPIAPVVPRDRAQEFFEGPTDSPYMNFVHFVRQEHRDALTAIFHPDGSTRVQTLDRNDDPVLYEILSDFEEMTGYPILVNTSLNGAGEPIVETPDEALDFFLSHEDVDILLLSEQLIRRKIDLVREPIRLAPDTIATVIFPLGKQRVLLMRRSSSMEISNETFEWIRKHEATGGGEADAGLQWEKREISKEILQALRLGLMVYMRHG